jgi:hypothetical protein
MMSFVGSHRGFVFVRYTNREDARRAVRELNNFEIRCHSRVQCLNVTEVLVL